MTSPRVPADGIYVPSPTFFKNRENTSGACNPAIDVETQVAHSLYLAKSGITGLVLMGSTGEPIHLNRQERLDVISGVRKGFENAGLKDYPIIAGVLINNTDEVLECLEDARSAGAQWGLVLAPGYFGCQSDQQGIVEWFTIVADRSPIPILIYNFPAVTNGLYVSPETYVALAAHPNIVGCKMTHNNVSHHIQVSLHPEIDSAKFRVYSGLGHQLGPVVLFHGAGAIDAAAGFFPKTLVHLQTLLSERPMTEETMEKVRRLQWLVSTAEEFISVAGMRGIREAIFRLLQFGNLEGGRAPMRGKLPEGEWQKWSEIMQKMSQVESSLE